MTDATMVTIHVTKKKKKNNDTDISTFYGERPDNKTDTVSEKIIIIIIMFY